MECFTPDSKQEEGGGALVSLRVNVQDGTTKIHEYVMKIAAGEDVLSEYLRQPRRKEQKE